MATKILILGAGGFIGRHLVEVLSQEQHASIKILKQKVVLENYESTINRVIEQEADLVLQLAWSASSTNNYREDVSNETWEKFTVDLANACKNVDTDFLGVGSEVEIMQNFSDPYSRSKQNTFGILRNSILNHEIAWARLGYVFDQVSESPSLIKEICSAKREKRTPLIRNLNANHDFVHVKDVANALRLMIMHREYGLFEIGSGKIHSVREVAESLGCTFAAAKEEEIESLHSGLNIDRLLEFGYVPSYTNEFFRD